MDRSRAVSALFSLTVLPMVHTQNGKPMEMGQSILEDGFPFHKAFPKQ